MREKKDSGVEWIGVIPNHWHIKKVKYLFEIVKRIAGSEGFDILSVTQKGLKIKDISSGEGQIAGNYSNYQFVYPNDFVMNHMDLLTGWIDVSQLFGVTSPDYRVFRLMDRESHNIDFFKYVMQNCYLNRIFYSLGQGVSSMGRWRLQTFVFNNFDIPIPPLKEQQSIANFLDTKCAEIDALMEDIRAEISTLEEYKKSVITEAVTKGLNPDAEMKDSGVAWVGKCPGHWEQHPVYYYFSERKAPNVLLAETNLLSLSYGKIKRKDINTNGGLLPASFNTYNIIEDGDIIIRPTDLQNDKRSLRTALSTEHGIITSAYIALRPKLGVNSAYFHYLLHAYDVQKVFYNMGNGVRQGLNYSEFSKLMLLAPPVEEQQAIVSFLDAKSDEIAATIAEKQKQLTTLEEYKKSLIYEYITGKKEVP